jgi:single-strand DNA-binding protein
MLMAGYNRIIIVGNLTRDPDFKQLPSGQSVCRLALASNRQFKNKQTGMMGQEVCYVDVDVWGAQAETCRQYLAKGRPVLVEGRLKLDTWQDAQGANRSKHSISADRVVFLSSNAGEGQGAGADLGGQEEAPAQYSTQKTEEFIKIEEAVAKKAAAKKMAAPAKKDKEVGGLPEFKDEPPFEDELPF